MKKLEKNQEQLVQKERRDKCLKQIQEEFKEFQSIIQKLNLYSNVTNELFLGAYELAKKIQDKYEYKANPKCILEKIGVKTEIQLEKEEGEDYCYITLGENIKVTIRYHIFNKLPEQTGYKSINETLEEYGTDHTTAYNNETFLCYYALVMIIMFSNNFPIDISKKLYYETVEYKPSISEEIAQIVSNFMLYISYDYEVRQRCYSRTMKISSDGIILREMPRVEFKFRRESAFDNVCHFIRFRENIRCDPYNEKSFMNCSLYESEEIYNPKGQISNYTLTEIRRCVTNVEEFKEEYEVLSKMYAPEDLYLRYKNRDYTKLGPITFKKEDLRVPKN